MERVKTEKSDKGKEGGRGGFIKRQVEKAFVAIITSGRLHNLRESVSVNPLAALTKIFLFFQFYIYFLRIAIA